MHLNYSRIIITSDEPYSQMWHTQLIYADYLSKDNKVIFIEPPQKWSFRNLWKRHKIRAVTENLTVVNYLNKFPAFLPLFYQWNEEINQQTIFEMLQKDSGTGNFLFWHFDSYRGLINKLKLPENTSADIIYHVIDPFYKNPLNERLSVTADLLIVTSPRIKSYYQKYAGKLINIPQAIDLISTKRMLESDSIVKLQWEKGFFVLLATFSDDIDYEVLLELTNTPDFKLVLIGKQVCVNKTGLFKLLIAKQRVQYLDALPPSQFYPVLKKATAGIVVYSEERRKKICSPLKAINYLVSGLPVITNIDCEIPSLNGKAIFYAANAGEYQKICKDILQGSRILDTELVEIFLQSVSLDVSVNKISEHLHVSV